MPRLSEREMERRAAQRAAALSEQEAARYIGMSFSWLRHARLRQDEDAPPHLRIGRAVRYRTTDLDGYLETRLAAASK
jgi:predicted DNA-binding transcriptional regulator AlpA